MRSNLNHCAVPFLNQQRALDGQLCIIVIIFILIKNKKVLGIFWNCIALTCVNSSDSGYPASSTTKNLM